MNDDDEEDVVVVVPVDVVLVVVAVVVVVGKKMLSRVGLAVGTVLGALVVGKAVIVGSEVGRAEEGDDGGPPQPLPILIATSAQFQNCSGTPRPSGGIL